MDNPLMRASVSPTSTGSSQRVGFTLAELLVSLGIVGLLLALLIPAVQQARATARNATCKSHLRQLGIAAHSYVDVHQVFPGYVHASPGALYSLLPFVGEAVAFERAEAAGEVRDRGIPRIEVYLCPEDPTNADAATSYLINKGLLRSVAPVRGFLFDPVRPRDVTDGLSQTAYFSEAITNNWSLGFILPEPTLPLPRSRAQVEDLALRCQTTPSAPHSIGRNSSAVMSLSAGYNHLLPPNSRQCNLSPLPLDIKPPIGGHPGGVNVLIADGSVRFASEEIDNESWLSLGTINSKETTSP